MPLYNPNVQMVSAGTTNAFGPQVVFADGGGVSFGVNGSTVTATVQAGAAAGIAAAAAGTQTQTSGTLVLSNSNGMSFGMSNSSLVTASYAAIKSISGGTTRATNGEVVFSNSNGMSFGVDGNTVTMSNDAFRQVSIGANTVSGSQLVFANSHNISWGLNGSTITADADAGYSHFPLYPLIASGTSISSVQTNTSAQLGVWGFTLDRPTATNASLGVMWSMSYVTRGTSAGSNSLGVSLGLFSMGTGTQSTRASQISSWSFGISDSYSNSTMTINFPTTTSSSGFSTATTSSNGLNLSLQFTGMKRVNYDLGQTLDRGHYFLAIIGTQSSSSISGGPKMSVYGNAWTQGTAAPIGTNNYSTGTNMLRYQGNPYPYVASWSTVGGNSMPASFAISQLTANAMVPHALIFAVPT